MKTISRRLVLLFILASGIPLILLGTGAAVWSYFNSRRTIEGALDETAKQAAEKINRFVQQELSLLSALSQNIQRTGLNRQQKNFMLKNYVIHFPALQSIVLLDLDGREMATSEVVPQSISRLAERETFRRTVERSEPIFSSLTLSDKLLPVIDLAVPVRERGKVGAVLYATLNILQLWDLVEELRVGEKGYCLVAEEDGTLIAHGDPRGKAIVLEKQDLRPVKSGENYWGEKVLQARNRIHSTGWQILVEQPHREAFSAARKIAGDIALSGVVVLAAAFLMALLVNRRFLSAIQKLREAAHRLARGDFDHKVAIAGNDEFALLGNTFNQMGDDLKVLQQEVAKRERTSVFGRMAAALTHDLKHPIQNLRLSNSLLEKNHANATFRKQYNETFERELAGLTYLIDRLNDLAKPNSSQKISVNILEELAVVLKSLEAKIEQAGIAVQILPGPRQYFVLGDPMAIRRMLTNILCNAIEATQSVHRLRHIRIELQEDDSGKTLILVVRDNGCGVAPNRLAQIFDPFVSNKKDHAESGVGLGMTIVKEIVEAHGGSVWLESQEDEGTSAWVTLPQAKGAVVELFRDTNLSR